MAPRRGVLTCITRGGSLGRFDGPHASAERVIATRREVAMVVKKAYTSPELKALGSVADLTRTGLSQDGGDAKRGSITHSEGV